MARTPNKKEQAHIDAVREIGCIVCRNEGLGLTPASIHHCDGHTKPGAHYKTLPLCHYHHQEGSDCEAYTSRHPWKTRFISRYGTEEKLLEQVNELLKRRI